MIPQTNLRIGFAFHQDPKQATGRYPSDAQEFVYNLQEPGFLDYLALHGAPRPEFAQRYKTDELLTFRAGDLAASGSGFREPGADLRP